MLCARVAKTPIVVDIPEARIDGVDDCESDEHRFVRAGFVDAVDAQGHVEDDRSEVFAAIEKMGKLVTRIPVSANTLQGTPYTRQAREKAHSAQMR